VSKSTPKPIMQLEPEISEPKPKIPLSEIALKLNERISNGEHLFVLDYYGIYREALCFFEKYNLYAVIRERHQVEQDNHGGISLRWNIVEPLTAIVVSKDANIGTLGFNEDLLEIQKNQ